MDIKAIRQRVRDGKYLIKSHAIIHALKEGFERQQMVDAVLNGKIIEDYQPEERVLICGKTNLTEKTSIYLHIVCEFSDDVYIEFITAYIPDELFWENPPFRRRQ